MTALRQRTNITLDGGLLGRARALGLNVSAISETALREAVRAAEARHWAEENAAALAERADWIAQNGPPLAAFQVLKT